MRLDNYKFDDKHIQILSDHKMAELGLHKSQQDDLKNSRSLSLKHQILFTDQDNLVKLLQQAQLDYKKRILFNNKPYNLNKVRAELKDLKKKIEQGWGGFKRMSAAALVGTSFNPQNVIYRDLTPEKLEKHGIREQQIQFLMAAKSKLMKYESDLPAMILKEQQKTHSLNAWKLRIKLPGHQRAYNLTEEQKKRLTYKKNLEQAQAHEQGLIKGIFKDIPGETASEKMLNMERAAAAAVPLEDDEFASLQIAEPTLLEEHKNGTLV